MSVRMRQTRSPHLLTCLPLAPLAESCSRGGGVLYATPGCFAHPKPRAFWLGGVSGDGQLSEGTGSVGACVGEGRAQGQ